MLVIRMQRTGRKGHAMFRVVVQDSRRTPTSGKIVANLGSYDPHNKQTTLDKEKAQFYLDHGAQPSDRAVSILANEGIKLPKWVKQAGKKERSVRNPEKRRSTSPDEPKDEAPAEESTEAPSEESTDATAEETAPKDEASNEEPVDDSSKEDSKEEVDEKSEAEPADDKSADA